VERSKGCIFVGLRVVFCEKGFCVIFQIERNIIMEEQEGHLLPTPDADGDLKAIFDYLRRPPTDEESESMGKPLPSGWSHGDVCSVNGEQ
jgi:hypothetical protein